ncbi:hydroxypyruvate isomerase family protein [Actibacterium pelagium]|uniref:Hydroxypyruvate isomerase n=1 Tax=Actibacterium pelagium TaxID=2029103 RepID=A0A917ANA1_9RHOB|nr:TIM barrel protein [Actibacterium pelagium]GGE61616.1 hydroxypyruvate isomerase [Actibacterium pelagium]
MKFSANLGFLWNDRPLPDAIRAAKDAGFDAVECHWPYDVPALEVKAALQETGLTMLGLNTRRGDVRAGENGLSAIPGREIEARAAIDEAIDYAVKIGARNIHVMAGFNQSIAGGRTFVENLEYACKQGAKQELTMLIEPLNEHDAPGYFLRTTHQAAEVIDRVGASNLKLMFDCYHVGRTEGDVISRLRDLLPLIGHIQFASVPDRAPPDHGDIDYRTVFSEIEALGWHTPLGAEYKPKGETDASLAWMSTLG